MSDHEQTLEEYWKKRAEKAEADAERLLEEYWKKRAGKAEARAEKAEADRDGMMLDLDSLQCDVASALGWDCGGVVFAKLVRGYVMAHEIERADAERLRKLVDEALACLQYPDNGHHYCRWCSAGTHNDWQHEEHCGYAAQCRKIEGVRTKAEALAAKEASDA